MEHCEVQIRSAIRGRKNLSARWEHQIDGEEERTGGILNLADCEALEGLFGVDGGRALTIPNGDVSDRAISPA